MPPNGSGLTITNPLVLYRSLVATQKIRPDPAQHRLALHLQNLYDRLIDYEPTVAYGKRLQQLTRAVDAGQNAASSNSDPLAGGIGRRGIWTSLLAQKEKRDSMALTRTLTSHEEAMQLQSPKGLMLHGEVGTGKSMLIDLFQDCLPNRKKRRWHFNTFMLDTISRLEQLRMSRSLTGTGGLQDEYSLLVVARDLIEKSPILFLDEFQLPDRVAAKILSNLMTSFFQLGGVLIATSNRMPEELAKAAGMDFARPVSKLSRLGWRLGMSGSVGRDDGPGQLGEFAAFLQILRARCEVWEMEGKKDYRKLEIEEGGLRTEKLRRTAGGDTNILSTVVADGAAVGTEQTEPADTAQEVTLPKNYIIQPSTAEDLTSFAESFNTLVEHATSHSYPIPWTPATLTVYGRLVPIPAQHNGVAFFTFQELCVAMFGPADYITLASTYHTFIITDIPIMGLLQKSEARRLITLLDAMYEARCRLLITAAAGPDDIFFPEKPATSISTSPDELANDAVHSETYSEIHQDLTSPFRPNISSYANGGAALAMDALEDDPPNRYRKPGTSFTDERRHAAPDFSNVGGLTGEDEQFAVKRAQSRIWEMCSGRWWGRDVEEKDMAWWRPLPQDLRHWERAQLLSSPVVAAPENAPESSDVRILQDSEQLRKKQQEVFPDKQEAMFPHGASPFRTDPDAPPKISWTHVWGTVQWGKGAGAWGKGVDGLEQRKREKDGQNESGEKKDK
ncbi:mitochondrial ATPase [Dothidotthia symphoricarpi CBS 119687]|uniref:Mitochondrial ATPase n=1 Tax=Dothidotthia symphoricarpi CBS 119687 TaxID=1392245 RepID=A0A6A6A7I1_9PLEO|nr:mitochondrial ATPase [Dothidotthia symphoricarpi CBS 119687]KAF2127103.1 mitochondrial ATPase [Dothidotthia symphoricarpi CBS 119687]